MNRINLRISGGALKGMSLSPVDDKRTRYTPVKVKDAVFSILGARIGFEHSTFLDLCAGSGQMGIEAVSRGFSRSDLVDLSGKAIGAMKKTINAMVRERSPELAERITIYKRSVKRFLKQNDKGYDVVFCDAPFNQKIFSSIVKGIDTRPEFLKRNGFLLIERDKENRMEKLLNFKKKNTYQYGGICIELYERSAGEFTKGD